MRMCVIVCLVKPSDAHIGCSWKCNSRIFSMYLDGMLSSQICPLQMVGHFVLQNATYFSGHFAFQNALPHAFFSFSPYMPYWVSWKNICRCFLCKVTPLERGVPEISPPWFSVNKAFILGTPCPKGDPTSKTFKNITTINILLKDEEGHYAYSSIMRGIFHMYDYSFEQ